MYRGLLIAIGLMNFAIGVLALVQPSVIAGWVGFGLEAPSAAGEIRAIFGGGVLVLGVLFLVATAMSRPGPLLGALGLVFLGFAVGRVTSLLVDGWSFYTMLAFLAEAAIGAVSGYFWWKPDLVTGAPAT